VEIMPLDWRDPKFLRESMFPWKLAQVTRDKSRFYLLDFGVMKAQVFEVRARRWVAILLDRAETTDTMRLKRYEEKSDLATAIETAEGWITEHVPPAALLAMMQAKENPSDRFEWTPLTEVPADARLDWKAVRANGRAFLECGEFRLYSFRLRPSFPAYQVERLQRTADGYTYFGIVTDAASFEGAENVVISLMPPAQAMALMKRNPMKKYGSLPPRGQADQAVRDDGFTAIDFVRSVTGPAGPVYAYTATNRGQSVIVNVGRLNKTDRLDITYAPDGDPRVKKNPGSDDPTKGAVLPWSPLSRTVLDGIMPDVAAGWRLADYQIVKLGPAWGSGIPFLAYVKRGHEWYVLSSGMSTFQEAEALVIERAPPALVLTAMKPKENPARGRATDLYDPKEEQIRAQRQGIYESCVRKELGLPSGVPFRESDGTRLDAALSDERRQALIRRCMFQIGTGVPQRDGRLVAGKQMPTAKAIAESKARYKNVDALVRNRQDYEETLGLARKSGFYRIVPEQTRTGTKFFVWPMKPGQRLPQGFDNAEAAQREAARRNRTSSPTESGRWWKSPATTYEESELNHWLPPATVWR
jgi:hypothetical protein